MKIRRFSRPVVEPGTMSIDELLHRVDQGELCVPEFQRPFAWTPKKMLELFESIDRGYPIGSLVFWSTTNRIATSDVLGPLPLPAPPTSGTVTYLVDGLSRLTTLYSVLRLPADHPRDHWMWWIYRDLRLDAVDEDSFVHVPSGEPAPYLIPLRAVIRTMDFLASTRELEARAHDASLDLQALMRRAEALVQQIKSYKLSTVRVTGGTLEEVVTIFKRLNAADLVPDPSEGPDEEP